jgi:hypothetical protein
MRMQDLGNRSEPNAWLEIAEGRLEELERGLASAGWSRIPGTGRIGGRAGTRARRAKSRGRTDRVRPTYGTWSGSMRAGPAADGRTAGAPGSAPGSDRGRGRAGPWFVDPSRPAGSIRVAVLHPAKWAREAGAMPWIDDRAAARRWATEGANVAASARGGRQPPAVNRRVFTSGHGPDEAGRGGVGRTRRVPGRRVSRGRCRTSARHRAVTRRRVVCPAGSVVRPLRPKRPLVRARTGRRGL